MKLEMSCPFCGNNSRSTPGLLIPNDHAAAELRNDPFNPELNQGIVIECGECHQWWTSTDAVTIYRDMYSSILGAKPVGFTIRECVKEAYKSHYTVEGTNPLTERYFILPHRAVK